MKKSTLIPLIAALLLGAGTLFAETTDPELKEGSMPAYPEKARSKGLEGTVVVEALVDENGRVFAAEVVESIDKALDDVSLAAVRNWSFAPAMEDGKPTMKVVRIPINFHLIDPMKESVLQSHDRAIASKQ